MVGGTVTAVADYDVVDELGRGPQSTSFRARPPARLDGAGELVRLVVLDVPAGPDVFERVAYELSLFGVVGSSYLAPMLEVGLDEGRLWYSTALVEDGSLATAGSLERPDRIRAVADAARGAHHLHEHGIAHRDISPYNILAGPGRWRLGEPGLGHLLAPGQSVTGAGDPGALEFVDPGVVRGEVAGRASDIWSLGATLHRALTDRSVYPDLAAGGAVAAIRHVLSSEPVLDDSLRPQERKVIAGCLAADRAARPADALVVAQLFDDLAEEA